MSQGLWPLLLCLVVVVVVLIVGHKSYQMMILFTTTSDAEAVLMEYKLGLISIAGGAAAAAVGEYYK